LTVTVNVPAVMESDAKMLLVCIETATVESDEEYLTLTNALGQCQRPYLMRLTTLERSQAWMLRIPR
jgi:hypothetical protein